MTRRFFTNDDERFLRSIHICPGELTRDVVAAAQPQIILSAALCVAITEMYGEVNFDTWLAYRTGAGTLKAGRKAPRGILNS